MMAAARRISQEFSEVTNNDNRGRIIGICELEESTPDMLKRQKALECGVSWDVPNEDCVPLGR